MQGPVQRTRINHMIRITPIRLIGADGEQVGVVETAEAVRMAQEAGLDLVEISPDTRPPVCKIMDYGKYKYDLSKKENKGAKQAELKEIRLGRSIKIDPHDVQIRVDQARRFLMAGHKVMLTQRFRGREMAHKEIGITRLHGICTALAEIAKVEMSPRWTGKQASIVLAPDKQRIETYKRKLEAEGKKLQEEDDLEALEAQVAAQNALEGDDDDDTNDGTSKDGRRAKSKKDNRIINPVDDEVADLLGGA